MSNRKRAVQPQSTERPPHVLVSTLQLLVDRVPAELAGHGPKSMVTIQHAMVIQAIARYRWFEATGQHAGPHWRKYPTAMRQTDRNLDPLPIPRTLRTAGEALAIELLEGLI